MDRAKGGDGKETRKVSDEVSRLQDQLADAQERLGRLHAKGEAANAEIGHAIAQLGGKVSPEALPALTSD